MIREPYFSIFGIIVVLLAVGLVWRMSDGNNDWRVIEGATDMQAATDSFAVENVTEGPVLTGSSNTKKKGAYATEFKFNSSIGTETGSLEVVTELVMD